RGGRDRQAGWLQGPARQAVRQGIRRRVPAPRRGDQRLPARELRDRRRLRPRHPLPGAPGTDAHRRDGDEHQGRDRHARACAGGGGRMNEPLIYDLSSPGRRGIDLPAPDVPLADIPQELVRQELDLPEVSEIDVVRHFTRLSRLNHGIDLDMYPLGSCTMKYNPKLNEDMARLPGFSLVHPYQSPDTVQGALEALYHVQEWLKELGGFAGVSLQPAAGAHGELAGVLMMRKYHLDRGDTKRNKMLIPDSAHGTNPASTTMSGLNVVELPSDDRGNIDIEALRAECDDTVVGLMLTNPNTLGLFEEHLQEVVDLVRGCGGLMYGDGANFNALMGIMRPGR